MQISREAPLKKKEVDDVLGGSDAWKNVQTTTGVLLLWHRCASQAAKLVTLCAKHNSRNPNT